MKLISVKWKMYFWCCRWLVEVDDTDWHHVDNGWIVDTLLSIYYSQPNAPKRPLLEGNQADLEGPHYEDQWWIGARSYVRYAYSYWYSVRFKFIHFCWLISREVLFIPFQISDRTQWGTSWRMDMGARQHHCSMVWLGPKSTWWLSPTTMHGLHSIHIPWRKFTIFNMFRSLVHSKT